MSYVKQRKNIINTKKFIQKANTALQLYTKLYPPHLYNTNPYDWELVISENENYSFEYTFVVYQSPQFWSYGGYAKETREELFSGCSTLDSVYAELIYTIVDLTDKVMEKY